PVWSTRWRSHHLRDAEALVDADLAGHGGCRGRDDLPVTELDVHDGDDGGHAAAARTAASSRAVGRRAVAGDPLRGRRPGGGDLHHLLHARADRGVDLVIGPTTGPRPRWCDDGSRAAPRVRRPAPYASHPG